MAEINEVKAGLLNVDEPEIITLEDQATNNSARLFGDVSSSSQLNNSTALLTTSSALLSNNGNNGTTLLRVESRNRRSVYLDDNLWSDEIVYDDEVEEPESKSRQSSHLKGYDTDYHLASSVHQLPDTYTLESDPKGSQTNLDDWFNTPPDSPTAVNEEDWQDILDWTFLEQIELVPSDDELQSEDYTISVAEWRKMFFKIFATKIRRSKLMLRTTLPKLRKSNRLISIFVKGGAKLKNVQIELESCHKATDMCFNFQRYSYIICSEVSSGSKTEEINYGGTKYSFVVGRFSAINPLSLWDFNAFWNNKKDFQVASDTSPYLSMMASQWKEALKSDRVGRWIMMYEPEAVEFLKSQGETARARAEDLKEIHSTSRLFKLVLSEYIYRNKSTLLNGKVLKGREIIKSLSAVKKNEKLFSRELDFKQELEMCEFVLNPYKQRTWLSQLHESTGVISPFGFERERLMKKTIFLCDRIHWTWCLHVLLEEKVKAMTRFIDTTELTRKMDTNQTTSQITYTRSQVKQEIEEIKNLVNPLPSIRDLDNYIFVSTRKFIKEAGHRAKRKSFDIGLFNLSGVINERKIQRGRMSLASRLDSRVHNPFIQGSLLPRRLTASSSNSLIKRKWGSHKDSLI